MDFRPWKCQLPNILRERKIEPYDFYSDMDWSKQQYSAYANNRKFMNSGTLKTVAHKLGLPMDDIYIWKLVPRKRAGNQQRK